MVIPTLNEERHLPELLDDLEAWDPHAPVIVVDGGSDDHTRSVALERGCRVLCAPAGRGRQMNAGAAVTETPWILFLHADSRVDRSALDLARAYAGETPGAACFRLRIDHPGLSFRLIELGQRLRERWLGLPYGDQGLLVHTGLFVEIGGFPETPLMEDVLVVRQLEKRGMPVERLPATVRTSPRRYAVGGAWKQVAGNAWRISRFLFGVDPARLAGSYPPRGPAPRPPRPPAPPPAGRAPVGTVAVFAKAPRRGRVKTRLASGIGPEGALRVYEHLLRRSVLEARASAARVVVCYDPEDGRPDLEALLGSGEGSFRFQGEGDLGDRMDRMLTEILENGEGPAVVMGTDIPGLDRDVLSRAFQALGDADLVLGPSLDGGYYLLGLHRPAPELFSGMAWSTPGVLAETRRRAQRAGLRVLELEPLRDVDEASDLTEDLHAVAQASNLKGASAT